MTSKPTESDVARPRIDRDGGGLSTLGQGASTPYWFSTPAIFMVAVILAFPVLAGIWESFFRPEQLGKEPVFVGLQNYVAVLNDAGFYNALYRTALFAGGTLLLATVAGLFFAFALFRVVGRWRFFRSVTVAPYIISSVAAAVMFRILFNGQFGLVNVTLGWFGVDGPSWFADTTWAMFVLVFAQVWTDVPLTVLLLLGGLMTIDSSYLDAALVDGATSWQRARYITIPLLTPQLLISTIWLSYKAVTGLGMVLPLTGGGPLETTNTLPIEMYRKAFLELNFSEGLAIATIVIVLNAALTLLYVRVGRRFEVEV